MAGRTKYDITKRLNLYNQGLSDKEISKLSGALISTIACWRSYHKLPVHRDKSIRRNRGSWKLADLPFAEKETVLKFVGMLEAMRDKTGIPITVNAITKGMDIWREKGGIV